MEAWIGKNSLLAIMLLVSGAAGQGFDILSIKPALAVPSEAKFSHQDSELELIYLTLTEKTQYNRELPTPHLSKSTEATRINQVLKQPVLLYLEKPDISNIKVKIEQADVKAILLLDEIQEPANINKSKIEFADPPLSSSQSAAQLLDQPVMGEDSANLQKVAQQAVQEEQQSIDPNEEQELRLRVRPRPQEELPPPPQEKPAEQFQPIGYLKGYVGYFQTSNIFSTNDDKIQDGIFYTGLTLTSAYFPLSPTTYINGSIDGGLIRYLDQGQFNYNQVRFNLGIYQQITPEMYAELNFSNQMLFYARNGDFFAAGDRFLNENSVQLSLGRRDELTDKLTLDSLYELSANFADPDRRSRIVNSFWLSLGYAIEKPLQVGLNYQFTLSDFTQREREDQFHRLFGHLNYRVSDTSNLYLQGGFNFGGSTTPDIDFSSWFFSVNYGFEIGRF
jgi:hypothetical protein